MLLSRLQIKLSPYSRRYQLTLDICFLSRQPSDCQPGTVSYDPNLDAMFVCDSQHRLEPAPGLSYDRLRRDLVAHWKMDEETGDEVADDSGFAHHGSASGASPTLAQFSRGRLFDGSQGAITIPQHPGISFGLLSFAVAGWAKIRDVTYPRTTFAVIKGHGCYFEPGRDGWEPGWEVGHGYQLTGTRVCIRDQLNNKVDVTLRHDQGFENKRLIGRWAHFAVVFDRHLKKIRLYINGVKQGHEPDISSVTGSVDNNRPLVIGTLYGWQTDGLLDDYRLYHTALTDLDVRRLYRDHRV